MRAVFVLILMVCLVLAGLSREDHSPDKFEALVGSLRFETSGTIILNNGIGKIQIPDGYKYLEPLQAEKVLTELWGNPRTGNMTLGLLMPDDHSLLKDNCCVINLQYDEIGYVKDDDADAIRYDELLAQMKKECMEANEQRLNAGLEPVSILGWAFRPYYDKERKILHSATEVKVGDDPSNTLNYKVKLLGRKGVLVLHAVSPINYLDKVRNDLDVIMGGFSFSEVYRYQEFDPSQDQVSGNDIRGLVSGNILTGLDLKGIFLKYWPILIIAFVAFFRPVLDQVRKYLNDDSGNLSLP